MGLTSAPEPSYLRTGRKSASLWGVSEVTQEGTLSLLIDTLKVLIACFRQVYKIGILYSCNSTWVILFTFPAGFFNKALNRPRSAFHRFFQATALPELISDTDS